MSSSPKYSRAELEAESQRRVEMERKRQAEIEAQQRRKREEEERRKLEAARLAAQIKAEQDARDALIGMQAMLAGIEADKLTMAWCNREVSGAAGKIAEMERLMASEQWDAVMRGTGQVKQDIDLLLQKAQDCQLKADVRQVILEGMRAALLKKEFDVGDAYLEKEGDFTSDVIIMATRPGGRSLQVNTTTEGEVSYIIKGYPMRQEIIGGKQYATCEEAQTVIESFQQMLQDQFGIKMTKLDWADKPPDRISRQYKEYPDGGTHEFRQS